MKKSNVIKTNYKDRNNAHIKSLSEYKKIYTDSISNPDKFWAKKAERIDWIKKWDEVSNNDFNSAQIEWFKGGKLNVSYNCLDRHVNAGSGDEIALIWEGNDPKDDKKFSYSDLLIEVSKFSNVLKNNGIKKGDRVCI